MLRKSSRKNKFILWFDEISKNDLALVGGKSANLGEMYCKLKSKGIRVPGGFAVTAAAYRYFIEETRIAGEIRNILSRLDKSNIRDLQTRGRKVRELILKTKFPKRLTEEIVKAYRKMPRRFGYEKAPDVAVRSSATAEDLPGASFAGQQDTYLNIKGEEQLLIACKKCLASLFTDRAISYREDKGFDHFKVCLSIAVQKMVRSDLAASGVMFTLDTESGFRGVVFMNSAYGLGENVVQGRVNPDEFYIHKRTLYAGYKPLITKSLGDKKLRLVYSGRGLKNIKVSHRDQKNYAITDEEALKLAYWACEIERHYGCPMDIEWGKDGKLDKLFILQARPETVHALKKEGAYEEYALKKKSKVLASGHSVGEKIGSGKVNIIRSAEHIRNFKKGQVLVTEMTDPDWEPVMKIASAIVTEKGGRTCFAGDTKVLTDKGFMNMFEAYRFIEDGYHLRVPSLNRETLKIEWRDVSAAMRRKAEIIEVETSQTGRMKGNILRLTPDHKMLTFDRRELVSKEIGNILDAKSMLLVAQNLPALADSSEKDRKLAYLLGAIMTDGHIHLTNRHGEVQFIQKPTIEKQKFIATVCNCMQSTFGKDFSVQEKPISSGFIRGRPCFGQANAYRCYSKQIATQMMIQQQNVVETMLVADEDLALSFLAGVIDGDGTYNAAANRINVYCSNDLLLQAIVVGCLRIGVVPQVTMNRTIYNIQIVEKVDKILSYTTRVKGMTERMKFGTRFFSAKSLLGDIIYKVNYKGRILPYVTNNLLIDSKKIEEYILPGCDSESKLQLQRILQSDTRMQRASLSRTLGEQDVYNLTVEGTHNYVVFTDRYTPIIVNNCHAAIVSRELGIPCIVGAEGATKVLKSGKNVTVACSEGDIGYVYDGLLKYEIEKMDLKKVPKTHTKVMMNVGIPEHAFGYAQLPNDGVGLARQEFIINADIGIHPLALINYPKLKRKRDVKSKEVIKKIDELTEGYDNKAKFYVDKLAQGVGRIAAAFYPKPVIVRLSDFKSNEYRNLIGGELFEPFEDNPMIGWRGAARYYTPMFRPAFDLECKALRKVRDEFGMTNVKIMVPFCRTLKEGAKVINILGENGLKKGAHDLQIYVMCEIPSNVLLAKQFARIFDGFSIGSNDLTQLTLGVDRDSSLVASIYDERNEAVEKLVSHVIKVAKEEGVKIGICGQAPSDYPDFVEFLIKNKIDSVSLNPDTVVKTKLQIANIEKRI